MNRLGLILATVGLLGVSGLGDLRAETGSRPDRSATAKYVILLIGDGMGTTQRTLGELYARASHANAPAGLTMNQLPVTGVTETASADSLVTDSAAAGTALATGHKTANGVLGMSADGAAVWPSIAWQAARRGMKVGIVSTVSLDHATPASFYAHQPSRNDYYDIAMQLPASGFDYFAGGGLKGRYPRYRQGRADPFDAIRAAGYVIVRHREQLASLDPAAKLCLFSDELDLDAAMGYAIDRRPGSPDLAELTHIGIERLDGPGGFFLMVEGGRIDWACHENDAATTAAEVLDFDRAVAVALDFYHRHPDETLIIVTADHETGGLGLGNTQAGYQMTPAVLLGQNASGRAFARRVAQFRRERVPFDRALPEIFEHFGFARLTAGDLRELIEAYRLSMNPPAPQGRSEAYLRAYGGYDPLTIACLHILSRQAGLGWTTLKHTGSPVVTSAIGVGAESFSGHYHLTDLSGKILARLPKVTVQAKAAPAAAPPARVESLAHSVASFAPLASPGCGRFSWRSGWVVIPATILLALAMVGTVGLLMVKFR